MSIKITRMFHAAVNAENKQDECRAFYTDFLGIPEVPVNFPGVDSTADDLPVFWLEKSGVQMHVISIPKKGEPRDPANNHVSWYVQDIGAAVAAIMAKGLEMETIGEGRGQVVWISDPAGNTMEFQQDPDC